MVETCRVFDNPALVAHTVVWVWKGGRGGGGGAMKADQVCPFGEASDGAQSVATHHCPQSTTA